MDHPQDIPTIVKVIPLDDILRIDAALEGNWSSSVVTVWSREAGHMGFSKIIAAHPTFKPSLELYFRGVWIGIHCFRRTDEGNVFDTSLAEKIIQYVENKLRRIPNGS